MEKHLRSLANVQIPLSQKEEDFLKIQGKSKKTSSFAWKPTIISIVFVIICFVMIQIGSSVAPLNQALNITKPSGEVESILFSEFGKTVKGKSVWYPYMTEVKDDIYINELNQVIAASKWGEVPEDISVTDDEYMLQYDSGEHRIFNLAFNQTTSAQYFVNVESGFGYIYENELKDWALQNIIFKVTLAKDATWKFIFMVLALISLFSGMILSYQYKKKTGLHTAPRPISTIPQGIVNVGGLITLAISIFVISNLHILLALGVAIVLFLLSIRLQKRDEHIKYRTLQIVLYNIAGIANLIALAYM